MKKINILTFLVLLILIISVIYFSLRIEEKLTGLEEKIALLSSVRTELQKAEEKFLKKVQFKKFFQSVESDLSLLREEVGKLDRKDTAFYQKMKGLDKRIAALQEELTSFENIIVMEKLEKEKIKKIITSWQDLVELQRKLEKEFIKYGTEKKNGK